MREAFLKDLFSWIECDGCGRRYEVADIEILGREENVWRFMAKCRSCNTHRLISVVVKEGKDVELVTDYEERVLKEPFLKKLFSRIQCDGCGHGYEVADIEILGEEGNVWLFGAYCHSCDTQGLIAVVGQAVLGREGKIAEVVTDLKEAEYEKFADGATVGINDVLDIHNILKDLKGDL